MRGLSGQLANTQRDLELRGILERSEPRPGPYPETALDTIQRLARLRTGPWANVNLEPLMELARLAEEVRFESGEVIWRKGEPASYGLNIVHGIVRCTSDDGRRVFRMGDDSVLGYLDANAGGPRPYDAVTETRVVALRLTSEQILDVLEDHQEVGVGFVRFLANIIVELNLKAARADRGVPHAPPT